MDTIYVIGLVGEDDKLVWDHPITKQELDFFYKNCLTEERPKSPTVPTTDHPLYQYLVSAGCKLPEDGCTELKVRVCGCIALHLPTDEYAFVEDLELFGPGHYFYYTYLEYLIPLGASDSPPDDPIPGCRIPFGENNWKAMADWYKQLHLGSSEDDFWDYINEICQTPVIPEEITKYVSSLSLESPPKFPIDIAHPTPRVRIDWYQYFENLEGAIESQFRLSDDGCDQFRELRFKYWDQMEQDDF